MVREVAEPRNGKEQGGTFTQFPRAMSCHSLPSLRSQEQTWGKQTIKESEGILLPAARRPGLAQSVFLGEDQASAIHQK